MIILIGATILLLILIYQHFNARARLIDSLFPGPTRIPFLGKSPLKYINLNRLYDHVFETVKAYNYQPFRFWLFHKPYIAITDSKTAKIILSKPKYSDKMDAYDVLVPWLGRNHFLGSGEKWLQYRKFDAPLSNLPHEISDKLIGIFEKNCNTLCDLLKKHEGKKEAFDLYEYFSMYTLDNICEAVAGVELRAQKMRAETSRKPPLAEALECMENQIFYRNLIPFLRVDWIFHLTPLGRNQRKSIKIFRDFSQEVIKKKKEALISEHKNSLDKHEAIEPPDLICKHLLAKTFSEEEIQIELESCILGGHDTITSSLSFIFYALAEHPEMQEKVYSEVQTIFGDSDKCPNVNQLNDMKYTLQFIKETLRYYTPASVIGRYVKEDVYINEHQYIPKNTNVAISLGAIHRDPAVWPNPDLFDPERFSEENSKNMDPYAFVAFSAGPRNCLGYKLAMLEMKTTIAKMVRRFQFSLSDNPKQHLKIWMNMVITAANGFNLKIQPRK